MKRLPVVVFAVLTLATVAAFFIIQHLKVTTPLIAGNPVPFPAAINPVSGGTCEVRTPQGDMRPVDFRRTSVAFFLLHRSDDVDVYVVNESGTIVATLGSGVFMRALPHPVRKVFTWAGRQDNGELAPPGMYYVKVVLRHQGRTIDITNSKGLLEWVRVKLSARCPRS
ncbi:MAG: hypothetical protein ACJ764_09725 [Solirubrobacteraceae bacterium]